MAPKYSSRSVVMSTLAGVRQRIRMGDIIGAVAEQTLN